MIENGYLLCPTCGRKIMRIGKDDVVRAAVYCRICKEHHRVHIEGARLKSLRKGVAV